MNSQFADSRKVAEYLGKPHNFLLKKIAGAKCSKEFRQENFWQFQYCQGNKKPQAMFLLTYNGFFLLASTGFGKKSEYWRKKIFRLVTRWEESLENYMDTSREKSARPYVEQLLEHGKKLYKAGCEIAEKQNKQTDNENAANAMILQECLKNKPIKNKFANQAAIDVDWEEVEKENQRQKLDKRERNRLAGRRYRWNKKLVALGLPRIERGKTDLPETFEEYLAIFGDESPYSKARQTFQAIIEREKENKSFKTIDFVEYCGIQAPQECFYDLRQIAVKCFRDAGLVYKQIKVGNNKIYGWRKKWTKNKLMS